MFPHMLTFHGKIAGLALLPLLIWGAYIAVERQKAALRIEDIQIGVEHRAPAALTLTRSTGSLLHLIDIANESEEILYVSLPESWQRGEVRGVPLSKIVVDEAMFGYKRWHLPVGATLSFRARGRFGTTAIQNPSGQPLRVTVITIDPRRETVERDAYLVSQSPLLLP